MASQTSKILEEGGSEERGENARFSTFIGALAITDLVKTTLGPKGMDKILQPMSGEMGTVTNDGATILKSIHLDNPAAKVMVELSKVQDDEIGDGTTSVCVLAGELLREGEKLIDQKLHPQTIVAGWRLAKEAAMKALNDSSVDNSKDQAKFEEDLLNIARTTLSSKILDQHRDYFSKMAVDAVLRLKGSTDLGNVHILKKTGGNLRDSYLEEGFVLNKKFGVGQKRRLENPKVMVANTSMDTDKIKIYSARVRVSSPAQVAAIEKAEKDKMKKKVEKICAHGMDVFINRQLIYNYPEQLFTQHGIVTIEHADFEGVERLSKVLGADVVSTFDMPDQVTLGSCKLIDEVMIGEDNLIRFKGGAKGEACTIVLRGPTKQLLDEAERSLHDALAVLSQTVNSPAIVYGGGASEMLMAEAVEKLAAVTPGKKAMAIQAYASALRAIPAIIANNAGYDSTELVSQLRAAHAKGSHRMGLDMVNGKIDDSSVMGITEPLKSKAQIVASATEAAEMITRVDDVIRRAPRQRQG